VQRFGGFVAKYMGDGVLIYFGYPQAHEGDAERAVRAGAAVGSLTTHAPLKTCVGIATGLVAIGFEFVQPILKHLISLCYPLLD
jgi:class 3 adenylate cyclase